MVEKQIETAHDRRIVHYKGEDGTEGPAMTADLSGFDWVPVAKNRMVDIPVQGSDGNTYYVLPFDLPIHWQIRQLLTVRAKRGPRRATREQVEEAIEKLRAFAAELED